ncbi:gamma-tubulin complex component [Trifolium repens]|nr:gamma-tubulin complex component [Trifolium repens]
MEWAMTSESLLKNLKIQQDPWLPPSTWERESNSSSSSSSSNQTLLLSTLSEPSLVRLATNALLGLKSSLITIQNISPFLSSNPPNTLLHLWNRASTTHSLSNILQSIASTGSLVFLLRHFVHHFTDNIINGQDHHHHHHPPYTLVNQAFAVAVGKVLEGYISGLHTIHASLIFRRSSSSSSKHPDYFYVSSGCLNSVAHSEITLLELFLHTKQLTIQIESLASICNLQKWSHCVSDTDFEDLITKATSEFSNFYTGANLLTFLYAQLQVADSAHCALLKFLFLQSCEPYCGFIRSWIFKAEIHDPYKEFIVENVECFSPKSHDQAGNSIDFPSASIRLRDGVPIPGFLNDLLVPLVRAGQQLQVLLKLLELCIDVAAGEHSSNDFLPCWSGFSSDSLSYFSPLTFNKDIMENMVLARESYYKRMNERIERLLSSLEVRYQQVPMHTPVPSFDNGGGTLDKLGQLMSEDEPIVCATADKSSSNMGFDNLDSDVSSTEDEFSFLEDVYGSSESSSLNSTEEQLESDQFSGWPCPISGQQNHLSALKFLKNTTLNSSIQKSCHHEKSDSDSHGKCDKMGAVDHLVKSSNEGLISSHMFDTLNPENSGHSSKFSIQQRSSCIDNYSSMLHLLNKSFDDDGTVEQNMTEKPLQSLKYSQLCPIAISDTLSGEILSEDQHVNDTLASYFCAFQPLKAGHQCNLPSINPFSKNLLLTRNVLLQQTGTKGEKCKADHAQTLPYFNFSTVEDPCKVYMDKLPNNSIGLSASSFPLDSCASAHSNNNNEYGEVGHRNEDELVDVPQYCFDASLDVVDHKRCVLTDASGGSSWERLLGNFRKIVVCDATQKQNLLSTFQMPLDIIIDKCLIQEIMVQYNYVSKLIINVLEEAFKLQEHLLALRRYHFMELADWADLFILSLWRHKWSVTEANERLPEIQGLLELSIQKSSCEQDTNKDRLFVYMKGHGKLPLSASAIGVRSFDFLGLGYHVNWPLCIILTPAALKIYADIFSFLIQVKLALFSLTDVWCSLKDTAHITNDDLNAELHQRGTEHLNILMKMRHQISHFVSTLQQYVESQLSHVSWCRFLHSLQHKVKDMMDLESVHMEYLADSLSICFLSDETKAVGSIIESILQCALDFRSCISFGAWDIGNDRGDLLGKLSTINISQVISIKQKFDRSLKELHFCCVKEPKHVNFGLSRFWEYLNYNGYYSHVNSGMGYCVV